MKHDFPRPSVNTPSHPRTLTHPNTASLDDHSTAATPRRGLPAAQLQENAGLSGC